MRGLACVLLIAGCASPEPRVTGSILMTADKAHVVSAGPVAYDLRFASSGLLLPEQLSFAGMDWITGGGTCPGEAGVGVNVYPAIRAVATLHGGNPPSALDPTTTIEVEMNGPAIARVRSHWAVDYGCESHPNTASGDLVFTLFPSGRIIRRDEHVVATDTKLEMPNTQCGCGQAGDYYFTSSWSFPDGATNLDATDQLAPDNVPSACAMMGGAGIAVAWPDRMTRLHPTGANAFVYDWARAADMLDVTEHDLTTRMQLGNTSSCAALLAELVAPALQIAGETAVMGQDGIYTIDAPQRGVFSIATTGAVPAGWAVALHLDGANHVKVTGAGSEGYLVQPDPGLTRTLIYFPEALAAGSSLSVEAN